MKHISLLIIVVLFVGCTKEEIILNPTSNTNNPLISPIDKEVQKIFETYKDDLNTVGLSIAIMKNGTISYYGYGETKIGNGIVPDKNTLFEIGSISKTYTTIAILNMLKENGHTIETPIREYLPNDLPTLARDGIEINFKHLLTHTSGLNYMPDNFGIQYLTGDLGGAFSSFDRNKLFSYLLNANLRHKPFTAFEYSNVGMGLLGTILELNYKKSYGDLLKENVLSPLSLNETYTRIEQTTSLNWAVGYANGIEAEYWNSLGAMDGAGVIKSSASDVMKYAIANIDPTTSALGNAINQSHQITFLPFADVDIYKINGRLGWFQLVQKDLPNESFIWHNGGTGGFNSDLYINKNKGTILLILANSASGSKGRENFTKDLLKYING